MSGMKFRIQCAGCNTTIFVLDRKMRFCPKCLKKRPVKPTDSSFRGVPKRGPAPQAGTKNAATAVRQEKQSREQKTIVAKSHELTPEMRTKIEQIYREQYAANQPEWNELVAQISDKVWLNRKIVSTVLHHVVYPKVVVTPEIEAQIIEQYRGYIERGERPQKGRRRTIGKEFGLPFHQVRDIVFAWTQSQYAKSPTPELTREHRFSIEKLYWEELENQRHNLEELPSIIAEKLGFASAFQIRRWLDSLNDDDAKFINVPELTEEVKQQIILEYRQYLLASGPPEKSLHSTIASRVSGITARQVHKALNEYRREQRAKYLQRNQ
ncbi:MAG: hypothetical protein L0220_19115 [Acidobacteria bacterium]|nr:hypothetical protein [Acidobacteriota bacterium]